MFDRLGHTVYRARRWVLAAAAAVLVLGATWGTGVFGSMIQQRVRDPGSESAAADARIEDTVGRDAARRRRALPLRRRHGRRPRLPGRRAAPPRRAAGRPGRFHHLGLDGRAAGPGGQRAGRRGPAGDLRRPAPRRAGDDDAVMDAYDALEPALRDAPRRAGRPARRNEAHRQRHHHPGQRGHRARRAAVDADRARAAGRRLRRPGRGQPAAGHRRAGDPRRVHDAAAADAWSPTSRSSRSTS